MTDIHGDTEYKSTITEITVHDASRNPLTHFEATVIRLADDGGGAYITITQGENEIRLDCNELPLMNEAIDRLMMQHKTKDAQGQEQSDNEHVLAIGQKWRRGDGEEVEVFLTKLAYVVGPHSPADGDSWWYLPNGECNGLPNRKNLALVELLQL
jgi:hypothetical protein